MRRRLWPLALLAWGGCAFVALPQRRPRPRTAAVGDLRRSWDEVLDSLDAMLGGEFQETDFKDARAKGDTAFLRERQALRERNAPPDDALQRDAVAVFFVLLGLLPTLAFFAAVATGTYHPFGLK